ncbi:MAG: bifunctional oligoribonuclease/PAP phosphatase NrnA [Cephaloticoccus sp.]|nr:bifunctional oligoribonuclease/PAP phosphatase NrnA [Cephaloticoccus sp.]
MKLFYPEHSPRLKALLPKFSGRKLAVVGHARPDGDCIGSQVGLTRVLCALGYDAVCVNADPVPRRLQFLTQEMTFLRTDDILPVAEDYAAIFVDCADGARCGSRLQAAFPQPVAIFDHHISNNGFSDHDFIDTGSAATAEILAGMFFDLGFPVDTVAAQALYTGILTDTGQFRFPSTSRRTFLLAAELLARGAQPSEAGFELYERETIGKLRLLETFLKSLKLECAGQLCVGHLPRGIFAATDSTAEDTEGLVDYARSIEGVDVGALIEERDDGTLKASLRSKNPAYRLDRIAGLFNGGGHACAAGLSLTMEFNEFYPKLVEAITRQIAKVNTGMATES